MGVDPSSWGKGMTSKLAPKQVQVLAGVTAQMASRLIRLTLLLLLLLLAGDRASSNLNGTSYSPMDPENLPAESKGSISEKEIPKNQSVQHTVGSSPMPTTKSTILRANTTLQTTSQPCIQSTTQLTQPTTQPTTGPLCSGPVVDCPDLESPSARHVGEALIDFSMKPYSAFSAVKKAKTNMALSSFSVPSLLIQVLHGAGTATRTWSSSSPTPKNSAYVHQAPNAFMS